MNFTLDFPVGIRLGKILFGSATLDIRKPFIEGNYYEASVEGYGTDGGNHDFFGVSDFEFGIWLGLGAQFSGFGFEAQLLLLNGATEGNHNYESITSTGTLSPRFTVDYLF